MRTAPALVLGAIPVSLIATLTAPMAAAQNSHAHPAGDLAQQRPATDLRAMLRSLDTGLTPSRERQREYTGALTINPEGRGVPAMYFDDFSSYPRSTDPIFDRFAVNMQDQTNPQGGEWDFSQSWFIPTLCVEGQFDNSVNPPLPDLLPRWQGADLVENSSLGVLISDINGDGVVDTADLGILLGSFGATGANPADLNGDMVVDTADLGILLGEFGASDGPFCVYLVDVAQTTNTDGIPLNPGTIAAGPAVAQTIAIVNGSYSNDVNFDGCPDCDFFRIETDGAINNELVYGTWSLIDPAQADLLGVDFTADVIADTCSGWGDEECLCDARGETDIIENQCCFFGARVQVPPFAAEFGEPIIADIDIFLSDIDTFQWLDWVSDIEGGVTGRVFMGGYRASLGFPFPPLPSPFMDRFTFLGVGDDGLSGFFATNDNPAFGASGILIKTGEWFTLRFIVKIDEIQFWLSDSETRALVDPMPGDNGDSTPFDPTDDIEDGFAKIFPTGPFGPATTDALPISLPAIPQPILAATSFDSIRILFAGDPTNSEVPGFKPHNVCYDNIMITGVPLVIPTPPPFTLPYTDDIEAYNAGGALTLQGDQWIDQNRNRAYIDDAFSASSSQSVKEITLQADGHFLTEFETTLPIASANGAPWTAGVNVSMSGVSAVRTIALRDDTFGIDPFEPTLARLLTGVEDANGVVEVDGSGFSTIHMRVRNPNFDPNTEPDDSAQPDAAPDVPPVNSRWLNVPTDAKWSDINTFHHFTFEVDAAQSLIVRRDGVIVNPDPILAPLAGYSLPGWTAGSVAIDAMAFESGNQSMSFGASISVDDVSLAGAAPVIAPGPPLTLPYVDGFEDYPANAAIDGQGDGRFASNTFFVHTLALQDPTASGRGNVLRAINHNGFDTDGGALFQDVRTTLPASHATIGTNGILELDCYVTDNNSRYSSLVDGPSGVITQIQFGGPDKDPEDSPGLVAVPATNFSLLENNPDAGGPFGMGPDTWHYDTGTLVPLNTWFRLRVTVVDGGAYTVAMDQSGVPGGDGVFESMIETASQGSAVSGLPIIAGADIIDGFDTNYGADLGGDGFFLRDPIEVTQDSALPGAFTFPDDFCFYTIDTIEGEDFQGIPPAPCNGVFDAHFNDVLGILRNAALPNWPNAGVVENCPTSPRFIWNDEALTGQCTGEWTWLDPDDPVTDDDFPDTIADVDSWGDYTLIPPYVNPGPASRWYFDNILIDGSPTP